MTMTKIRSAALRQMLLDHRRERQVEVEGRVREGRAPRARDVGDSLDTSDADIQNSLEFALLQMRAATLAKIEEALVRLDSGHYGTCADCGDDIAERRLRALPFAVRCHDCEDQRETEHAPTAHAAQHRGRTTLFPDSAGT
ncbi:MAG TPA: TraR/DksA C4-type zinc finger protein [Vicinamibacterales bacterium]|jgi:DnaK suppressor protein|nr:TraR/DksA C4-type zinc finger protein [Acidobacteriota bacterium]HQX82340.1 TraR/DksA C4-type zinc finger protein [Vicinamibacterales bacterium]